MRNEEQPCDFCGAEEMSNAVLDADVLVMYHDGPIPASIPNVVVCTRCAEEVSDYLRERAGDAEDHEDVRSPFVEDDVEPILDRLVENDQLVLDLGHDYGIRYVDDS